jgi:hypothetical protein
MNLRLCINNSEKNKINKSLTAGVTLSGTLRNESNVVNPSIVINIDNPTIYNYAYIEDFGRYYFITDYISLRNGIWQINLKSDVLMSFKDSILASNVLINNTETIGKNNYLSGSNWVCNCKAKTDILTFSHGLLNDGQYILITAGG